MAAPTSVRVESNSITTTMLRWAYSGSNLLSVYRSTDGASYSKITDPELASTTLEYNDTGLSAATKYWYKVSDDSGSTFSDVVTVWTHSCTGPISSANQTVQLPRFESDEVNSLFGDYSQVPGFEINKDEVTEKLNDMVRRIEAAFAGEDVSDKCIACPVDGAVAVDCSSGCVNWTIVADEDINSVSIEWCDEFDGTIDFIIPPGVGPIGICGLPSGFGFGGDECTQAPLSGGSSGRTLGLSYSGGGGGFGGGGGGLSPGSARSRPGIGGKRGSRAPGGATCECVPGSQGQLTIKSCTANNSLSCSSTDETVAKRLRLIACGGQQPYEWSVSSGDVELSGGLPGSTDGNRYGASVSVHPPQNDGAAVAGTAYHIGYYQCTNCGGPCNAPCLAAGISAENLYGCDDGLDSCTNTPSGCVPAYSGSLRNLDFWCKCVSTGAGCSCPGCGTACPAPCASGGPTHTCDVRTAPMIAAGCNPCGLQAGSTITVTDALGTQVTIILRA